MKYTYKQIKESNPDLYAVVHKEDITFILENIKELSSTFKDFFPKSKYDLAVSLVGTNGKMILFRKLGNDLTLSRDHASVVAISLSNITSYGVQHN